MTIIYKLNDKINKDVLFVPTESLHSYLFNNDDRFNDPEKPVDSSIHNTTLFSGRPAVIQLNHVTYNFKNTFVKNNFYVFEFVSNEKVQKNSSSEVLHVDELEYFKILLEEQPLGGCVIMMPRHKDTLYPEVLFLSIKICSIESKVTLDNHLYNNYYEDFSFNYTLHNIMDFNNKNVYCFK